MEEISKEPFNLRTLEAYNGVYELSDKFCESLKGRNFEFEKEFYNYPKNFKRKINIHILSATTEVQLLYHNPLGQIEDNNYYPGLKLVNPLTFDPRWMPSFKLNIKIVFNYDDVEMTNTLSGKLTCMPNCCGIAVISDLHTQAYLNHLGLGKELYNLFVEMAISCNYSTCISTDKTTGYGSKILDKRRNVKKAKQFKNTRSSNEVNIYIHDLEQEQSFIEKLAKKMRLNFI